MKIISWNINGIRSKSMNLLNKDKSFNIESPLSLLIKKHNPDIICFSEIRCQDEHCSMFDSLPFKYKNFKCCSPDFKKGYSGVAILSNIPILNIFHIPTLIDGDPQGRSIIAEFENFILCNVYTPNSGSNDDYRENIWDTSVYKYLLDSIDNTKPLIYTGDLNVIHTELDVYNKKILKEKKIPGTFDFERNAFNSFLELDYIDCFRFINPQQQKYSWFNPRIPRMKLEKKGFRLDYFLIHRKHIDLVKNCDILDSQGSDHVPIILELE